MATMSSKERIMRMYRHEEADRVPIMDVPWAGTIRRWHREGMPEGVDWIDYFDLDKTAEIWVNNSPRYPYSVLEETDRYVIYTTEWGVTQKSFKVEDSTPEHLKYTITTPEAWEEAKARMKFSEDRIDWNYLKNNYDRWIAEDRWITGNFWFGFDVTHSHMVGTETLLVAMYEEPEWVMDMFDTFLSLDIELFDRIWDAGYRFDCVTWPDDMGYKNSLFFSNEMYRELLKPFHKRAVDWAHEHGCVVRLHSCGDVMERVDDLMDIGIDALNPLEVKAGMKPVELKRKYGDRLTLHGGINAVLWDKKDEIIESIRETVPVLKENGGYIFASDHSIPNSVSLENMTAIINEVKRVGKYD